MKYFDWKFAGKAIAAGLVALIGGLILVITGSETLADVTFAEWLYVALTVLGAYGFTYISPANQGPRSVDQVEWK